MAVFSYYIYEYIPAALSCGALNEVKILFHGRNHWDEGLAITIQARITERSSKFRLVINM